MENSNIAADLYPFILESVDFSTLQKFKTVNKFCNELYKKEMIKRHRSYYPFGEKNATLKMKINDIFLEEIYCIFSCGEIKIGLNNLSMPWLSRTLDQWFHYSFNHNKWILTGKILKSVIRIYNKLPENERIDGDILTFAFKNENSYLVDIQ